MSNPEWDGEEQSEEAATTRSTEIPSPDEVETYIPKGMIQYPAGFPYEKSSLPSAPIATELELMVWMIQPLHCKIFRGSSNIEYNRYEPHECPQDPSELRGWLTRLTSSLGNC